MVSAEAATDGTLSGALASVTGSVRELQSELANELSGQEIRGFDAPDTLTQAYADAQATQQALVDGGLPERKRKERDDAEAIKLWAKPPGTSLIDPDVAPFLAYNEEYFRDITAADVANLVPAGPTEPADDPDYRVPALGRYYALEWEDEDAREAARARAEAARRAAEEEERRRNPPPVSKKKPKKKKRPRDGDSNTVIEPVAPLQKPEEVPDKCHVCWDGVSYDDNQILYCEGCDVAVHQECYGVRAVPKGDWFCRVCEGGAKKGKPSSKEKPSGGKKGKNAEKKGKPNAEKAEKKKTCLVCDAAGGALKPVAGGRDRWCHLFCSNWMPELFIKDLKTMEPVGGVENIDADRATLRCEVCLKPKGTGSCIQCDFGNCSAAYHPLCAALSGTHCMEIRSDMTKDGCEYKSFCLKHSKSRLARPKVGAGAEAKAEESDDAAESEDDSQDESEDDEPPSKRGRGRPPKGNPKPSAASTPEPAAEPSRRSARGARGGSEPLGEREPAPPGLAPSAGKENEPSVSSPRKSAAAVGDGAAPSGTDGAPGAEPAEALLEHTVRALRAPPPAMPTEPESAKPEEESSRRGGGGEKSSSVKPPKCAVCTSHKKGVCGTATAPLKCARRLENEKEKASSSDLIRLDAAAPKWDVAADGPPPAPAAEELKKLERFFRDAGSPEAFAPDDEIVGELLQAHAALARASWIARSLAAKALLRARDAGGAAERAAREEKEKWVEETSRYEERWRGGRWREEYLRRRGLPSADDGGEALADAFGDTSRELVDPLVETGAMEDALCAVCGGGDSEAPNEIVFCERCELAVHQDCYGVAEVPEGDWLCWPCHVAEANENEQGLPPSRPPRWLREAGDGALYDPRPACCLCPVRRGALRAVTEPQPEKSAPTDGAGMSAGEALIPTKDTSDCPSPGPGPGPATVGPPSGSSLSATRWAHVVCAQCVPGVAFAPAPAPGSTNFRTGAVIRGVERVSPSAFEHVCSLCARREGVTASCGWPGCATQVHPLCARRQGWLLSDVFRQEDERRVFCGRHSVAERRRIENGLGPVGARGGGGRGRGAGAGRGRGGGGGRGGARRRPIPTRAEMELLKRARFGLEKLRALCERTLRVEKNKRALVEAQAELWTMQMAGLDDGLGAETPPSPPPSPRRTETWMTRLGLETANAALPPGFAFRAMEPGETTGAKRE